MFFISQRLDSGSLNLCTFKRIDTTMADAREPDEIEIDIPVEKVKKKYDIGDAGRCKKQLSKRTYSKKRRFCGNQHTKVKPKQSKPASSTKVVSIRKGSSKHMIEGFRLIDMTVLRTLLNSVACPNCKTINLHIDEDHNKRRGLAIYMNVYCVECDFEYDCCSSLYSRSGVGSGKGQNPLEINQRAVYASRALGIGHAGLEKMCGFLNMPPPMTMSNYDKISDKFTIVAENIAEKSMHNAVAEHSSNDIGISVDGTWQKRGFVSLNGVVAVVSMKTGKVLDAEILSRYCRLCQQKKDQLSVDDFTSWYSSHKETCSMNHMASAPMMEVAGAKAIFERSVPKYGIRYLEYFGDGDSKAYLSVKNTYLPDIVVKKECVGHYQKRVGTRIRKAKKEVKGLRGLPDWMVDKLQNYFGIALRSNTGTSAKQMGDAIWASFLHVASSENNNFHSLCDKSPTSWCQYQRDRINGTNFYKPGPGLSNDVIRLVKPIYQDLIKEEEMEKCLHGLTQNHNESFNNMVWERAPKKIYISLQKMKFSVYDAIACFNEGRVSTLNIFKEIGIVPGYYTVEFCSLLNTRRKRKADYRWTEAVKKRRKVLRSRNKKRNDKNKSVEGSSYKSGGF